MALKLEWEELPIILDCFRRKSRFREGDGDRARDNENGTGNETCRYCFQIAQKDLLPRTTYNGRVAVSGVTTTGP